MVENLYFFSFHSASLCPFDIKVSLNIFPEVATVVRASQSWSEPVRASRGRRGRWGIHVLPAVQCKVHCRSYLRLDVSSAQLSAVKFLCKNCMCTKLSFRFLEMPLRTMGTPEFHNITETRGVTDDIMELPSAYCSKWLTRVCRKPDGYN